MTFTSLVLAVGRARLKLVLIPFVSRNTWCSFAFAGLVTFSSSRQHLSFCRLSIFFFMFPKPPEQCVTFANDIVETDTAQFGVRRKNADGVRIFAGRTMVMESRLNKT